MKNLYSLFLVFISLQTLAQNSYSKQFSLITDNDLYTSLRRDRYYTSGIFLNYSYLSKRNSKFETKKIYDIEIGHEMFTPYKAIVKSINEHDRPFAAHLYTKFGITNVFSKSIFSTNYTLGFIGPDALGKEIQDFIHDLYGYQKAVGWEYQIKNAISLNFEAAYHQNLLMSKNQIFDVNWINYASFGTVYTNVKIGFLARIGTKPLQEINNTLAFNTHLNQENVKRNVESFFIIKPTLQYVFYDATIQGSFLNTSSTVTKTIVPFVFKLEIGYLFTANRFNLGYSYIYNTKQSNGLRYDWGNSYGQLIVSYNFN